MSGSDFDSLFNDLMQQSSSGKTKNHPEIGLVSFELGWSHWEEDENAKASLVFTKEKTDKSTAPALQLTRKAGDALNRESDYDRVKVMPVLSKNKKNVPYIMFIPKDASERSKNLPSLWNSLKSALGDKMNDYLKNGTPFYAELAWHVSKWTSNGVEKENYTPCVVRMFATKEDALAEVQKQESGGFDPTPFEPAVYQTYHNGDYARVMEWNQFATLALDSMKERLANVSFVNEEEQNANVTLAANETFLSVVSDNPEMFSQEIVDVFVAMYLASDANLPF